MEPPSTPKKAKKTLARTAQTGDMPGLDYVGKQNITPKKLKEGEEDYDEDEWNNQTMEEIK
jgi:hypothetical protein